MPESSSETIFIAIDPVALSLGPFDIHWYGIMYLLSFLTFWTLGIQVAKRRQWWGWSAAEVGDLLFYGMIGVVVGGRLGYVLFYGFSNLLDDPLFLVRIQEDVTLASTNAFFISYLHRDALVRREAINKEQVFVRMNFFH